MSRRIMIAGAMLLLAAASSACGAARREPGVVRVETAYATTLGPGEMIRLELEDGQRYRLELEGRGARVELVPIEPGMMRPLLNPFFSGASLSRTKVYDFEVRSSGLYQLRLVDAGDAAFPVRVRLEAAGARSGGGSSAY